jgi:type VI secretion system protein ImpB
MASVHEKLERVRKPRVHLTYDVETEGAVVQRELPFVVGVLGDFSGDRDPSKPLAPLRDRKFIQIDRDNFNDVMARVAPRLELRVENTLREREDGGEPTEIAVSLAFNSIEDFEPGRLVEQIAPLKQLLDTRNRLRDLQSKADISVDLEAELEKILTNTAQLQGLAQSLGVGGATPSATAGDKENG